MTYRTEYNADTRTWAILGHTITVTSSGHFVATVGDKTLKAANLQDICEQVQVEAAANYRKAAPLDLNVLDSTGERHTIVRLHRGNGTWITTTGEIRRDTVHFVDAPVVGTLLAERKVVQQTMDDINGRLKTFRLDLNCGRAETATAQRAIEMGKALTERYQAIMDALPADKLDLTG